MDYETDRMIERATAIITTSLNDRESHFLDRLKESHQLVWLDANANNGSNDTIHTLRHLESIIDSTSKFDNIEDCLFFIEETKDMVFLICSGIFGQEIVPRIHQHKNIWAIYVYCYEKSYHESTWAQQYPKVSSLFYT